MIGFVKNPKEFKSHKNKYANQHGFYLEEYTKINFIPIY